MAEATDNTALIDSIRNNAGLTTVIGIIMLIAGLAAVGAPAVAGLSVTIMIGLSLSFAGIAQCFLAFKAGAFGKGLLVFLVGALMTIAGSYMVTQPLSGLASLTIFLMAYLLASGVLEIGFAFQIRPAQGWALSLTNGIVTALLGILLWRQFPLSGVWAVGVLFGIKMIFSGWSLIFIGNAFRKATAD